MFLAAFVVYANSLLNPLVYDDAVLLRENPLAQQPAAVGEILSSTYWGQARQTSLYRPLTVWSLALQAGVNRTLGLDPLTPLPFHAVGVLLHAGVGCALYALLRHIAAAPGAALVAALLFAVHPIHTEAVDAVVGRADILVALLGLLMLRAHWLGQPWLVSAIALLLALFSKESAIGLVPLAVALDLILRDRERLLARWPAHLAHTLVSCCWLALRAWAVSGQPQVPIEFVDNPLASAPVWQRVVTALSVQWNYLLLQLWPARLSSDYSFDQIPMADGMFDLRAFGFVVVATTVVVLAWRRRSKDPILGLCVAGYACLFATTSNILFPIGTMMAERLVYAPSLWTCAAAGCAVHALGSSLRRPMLVAGSGVLLLLAALTVARNRTWESELLFVQTQVQSAPRSAKALYNVGTVQARHGDDRSAAESYRAALKILPAYAEPWFNLGNSLRRLGASPESVAQAYRRVIENEPSTIKARANLALVLMDSRPREALQVVEELARLAPDHPAIATVRKRVLGTAAPVQR